MDSIILECSCSSEVVKFEYWKEGVFDPELCISIFSMEKRIPFFDKFRWIWHILRHGTPYEDQIILSKTNQEKLKEFLRGF